MGRVYTVTFSGTPSATVVPWVLTAGSGKPIRLLGFNLAFADAETDEQMAYTISTLDSGFTPGTGGTTPTPSKTDPDDAAASFTARINGTAPSGGNKETKFRDAGPLRSLACADPPLKVNGGGAIAIEVAATASAACVGTAVVEEF